MFSSLFKVAATGAATGKSKGYARIIETVTLKYFRYLSQTKKIQDVEKWVKLSTSWKKITFDTKPLLQCSRARNLQRRLSFLKGSILALCKEGRVYRIVGSMKYKLRAKRVGAEWYKICTKSYSPCISASLSIQRRAAQWESFPEKESL